ncbi:hypothetical protein BOX15_Mlig032530g3 [Macrostomum lignano]|uniref:Uncharacterized protein n=1 Tax=Macrostomum lignano TaxID=282301 RepID=A0A267H018_9PLAT|nr:hypothetical protein BOX15_Mlig032530g1 [Macrostomum lignano]PAA91626.1 hypothetical protein BOX15_Mlig032530g3 [Macrostomum lignano]
MRHLVLFLLVSVLLTSCFHFSAAAPEGLLKEPDSAGPDSDTGSMDDKKIFLVGVEADHLTTSTAQPRR